MTSGIIKLCRPKQWIKNGFVFGPLIFSQSFSSPEAVLKSLVAFAMFCLAASAVYIVNDIRDIEADRKHPTKSKSRPLASGQVTVTQGIVLLMILYVLILLSAFLIFDVFLVVLAYIAINFGYTYGLKTIPVVDIFVVASGFVLRVYAGVVAIEVETSMWMLITTLCLALYLASIKRRQELLTVTDDLTRCVLSKYSVSLVDRYAEMSATGALVFYSLFVLTERPELAITIPLVLLGLFRYWYVVDMLEGGESPTDVLWTDWVLIGCVSVWIGACLFVLGGLADGV
jgi:decaprenyl-phosphate phosphoribosyltransferase